MQNLFFLGIILVGKEKIPNKSTKTIQKQKPKKKKKIKASHFAVETVGRAWGPGRGESPKEEGGPGAACCQRKGVGVLCSEKLENKNKHMRSPQAPQTVSAKCAQEPQRFQ